MYTSVEIVTIGDELNRGEIVETTDTIMLRAGVSF